MNVSGISIIIVREEIIRVRIHVMPDNPRTLHNQKRAVCVGLSATMHGAVA
jgi:hypothetical protein